MNDPSVWKEGAFFHKVGKSQGKVACKEERGNTLILLMWQWMEELGEMQDDIDSYWKTAKEELHYYHVLFPCNIMQLEAASRSLVDYRKLTVNVDAPFMMLVTNFLAVF